MRVALDTNVWSYIAIRDEVARFEELEDARNLRLVIPPSTLIEALRTPQPTVRDQIIAAMTSRGDTRIHLHSEAHRRPTSSSQRSNAFARSGSGGCPT